MSMRHLLKKLVIFIPPLAFLIIGIKTIPDYGINWDEPLHFHRGQAYFHFMATGKHNFQDLPSYLNLTNKCPLGVKYCNDPIGPTDLGYISKEKLSYGSLVMRKANNLNFRRSLFQSNIYDYDYFMATDSGHPPASDILSAISNYVFYQRLGVLTDVGAHHLFEVVAAFLLILGVAIFTYLNFGLLTSLVSSISLAMYPLFFAESHFNIKDPPETAFFGLAIIAFYFGIIKDKWNLILLSAVSTGLALGTKFNALFLPVIIFPWLITYLLLNKDKWKKILRFKYWLILFPSIVIFILYFFWPYLWRAPINNLLKVINYYRVVGTGVQTEQLKYIFMGFNTYPLVWIIITTPIPLLLLSAVGLISSFLNLVKKREPIYLLVIFWFFLPIIRISLGNAASYGGVRQIMEYVPGMMILSGLGAKRLFEITKNHVLRILILAVILIFLSFSLWEMIKIHPNENLYFNQIVGGMAGAKAKEIPNWGNSYGNIYEQGVNWLNKNVETNARLTTLIGTMANINWTDLRSDIYYHNKYWSGPNKAGEYAIDVNYGEPYESYYRYSYYNTFLIPVYEYKIDGVVLLTIWKNDLGHTKPEYLKKEIQIYPKEVKISSDTIKIDLGKEVSLAKMFIKHGQENCRPQVGGYILTSEDGGFWLRQADSIDLAQTTSEASGDIIGFTNDKFAFYFSATKARYISVNTGDNNSCYLKEPKVSVYSLSL